MRFEAIGGTIRVQICVYVSVRLRWLDWRIRNEGWIEREEEETQRQSLQSQTPLSVSETARSLSHTLTNTRKMSLFGWIYAHTK